VIRGQNLVFATVSVVSLSGSDPGPPPYVGSYLSDRRAFYLRKNLWDARRQFGFSAFFAVNYRAYRRLNGSAVQLRRSPN
jgi:hypothetical protein